MSDNSVTVRQQIEEIESASKELRDLVYSAPSQWMWDSFGSALSVEQIAETIEKIENNVKKVQEYCDEEYKEITDALLNIMWSGLQMKNYEAILQAVKQLISIKINFENEPFKMKLV
ncbi:MAG: hypothetical protein ACRD32_05320 [Nitrososphaerales archaeon]